MILDKLMDSAWPFYDTLNVYTAIVFTRYKMLIGRNPKWIQQDLLRYNQTM
jgi:hypothetical protein